MKQIDINCDMGESFGNFRVGNDEAVFPYITSANIACGFHGGDPVHMEKTILNALKYGVKIGAHPGYPDLAGFGRRTMDLKAEELTAIIKYQVSAIKGMAESLGGKLSYVKPHGALYNKASNSEQETRAIIKGIRAIDPELIFMGLAGSIMEEIAKSEGIPFAAEAFADRRYEPTGRLMSRTKEGSVLGDAEVASDQVLSIARDHRLTASNGAVLEVHAQSVCIHGDNPAAVDILKSIDRKLQANGISKQSFS
ncbi:MAG: 5-oxoprolinase subunit PxpA [Bacteroidia bacterium]|nr:5-oxoprolinase subunit PxpA [Bacteroidia bacterium]